jgi:hypothetical protein
LPEQDKAARLGDDEALTEAIEAEKIHHARDGGAARERAQQLLRPASSAICCTTTARHHDTELRAPASCARTQRTDRTLRRWQTASVITINLNAEVLHFDKSIAIDANDVNPNDTDTAPQELPAIVAANQRKDDGGGDPL